MSIAQLRMPPMPDGVQEISPRLSAKGCRWVLRSTDERLSLGICQRLGVPEIVGRVLAARGICLEEADGFLNPSLKSALPDPSHLKDMDLAAERLANAVMNDERIAVFGDYDVDGATSSALLKRFFQAMGRDIIVYIPDRITEGYGPNTHALLKLRGQGVKIVVTVDCGTLSFEALEEAAKAGLDVIVVDHHAGEARMPRAVAVVNPNRFDETSPHRHLAAVGVSFLLAVAVTRQLRRLGWFNGKQEPDLLQLLDIVALGTVCDVVPLTGVNRALVTQGLKVMAARCNVGLRVLLDVLQVAEKPGVYHLGFALGPRINAGGRVGQADLGTRLLATEDEVEALEIARQLDRYNDERKAIESIVLDEAMAQAELQPEDAPLLLVASERWHPGVIGIVAGRLKERFGKPTAVVALSDGIGKASARSVPGFDFGAAVIAARDNGLLLGGGGHAMAAGFSVQEDKIAALREFLSDRVVLAGVSFASGRTLELDGVLTLSAATLGLAATLEQAGPFGSGNPSVRMMLDRIKVVRTDVLKEQHIKLTLADADGLSGRLSALAFRTVGTKLGDWLLGAQGKPIRLAGSLKAQSWMGRESVDFHIDDALDAD